MEEIIFNTDNLPQISLAGYDNTGVLHKNAQRTLLDYVLFIVTSGTMYITEGETEYTVKKGEMLLLSPGIKHFGTALSEYNIFYLHFNMQGAKQNGKNIALPKTMPVKSAEIIKAAAKTANYYNDKRALSKELTASAAAELLLLLAREYEFYKNTGGGTELSNRVLEYLSTSYGKEITSESIGKVFSYNFDYINQLFNKHFGTTVFKMLETIRIGNAKDILLTRNIPISEVAVKVGYNEANYFGKVFKRHEGLTPREYRKQKTQIYR